MSPGLPAGFLVGLATGLMSLLYLYHAIQATTVNRSWWSRVFGSRSWLGAARHICAVIVVWFGSPWVAASALASYIDWTKEIGPYLAAMGVTYAVIMFIPIVRLVIHIGNFL